MFKDIESLLKFHTQNKSGSPCENLELLAAK